MDTAVYTLTSSLHDENAVGRISDEFLAAVFTDGQYEFRGSDFSDFGTHALDLIFVRTGGSEGIFKSLLDAGAFRGMRSFRLLTSGKSNSLAASMEILSFLRLQGLEGEILHGRPEYVAGRIRELVAEVPSEVQSQPDAHSDSAGDAAAGHCCCHEEGESGHCCHRGGGDDGHHCHRGGGDEGHCCHKEGDAGSPEDEGHCGRHCCHRDVPLYRIGVIGQPSDWLISSAADYDAVRHILGVELVDIPMSELLEHIGPQSDAPAWHPEGAVAPDVAAAVPGANAIYLALRSLVDTHKLSALTLRCFDLLTAVHNTGCLALARLNAEGIPAGCEGDIPAVLSLAVARAVTGHSGFQANPSRIDPETGEVLFAHCTVPLDIVDSYEFDTHYESGIGVGVRGKIPTGPVTVFKISGDVRRCFIAEGELLSNTSEPDLCRTQTILKLAPKSIRYFLEAPIGNHHIIIPGHHAASLRRFFGI